MTGNQDSVETDLILHLSESAEEFVCDDLILANTTTDYSCEQRNATRPTETDGEWWLLDARLSNDAKPPLRSYQASASLVSDGQGSSSCLYMFGGQNYEINQLYSDLWRLCPDSGFLGGSEETTFTWTELSPAGTLPEGR